ncbi:molybdopterin-dependent oxidoreductase [Curtobacterium sp. RRHDQ66]
MRDPEGDDAREGQHADDGEHGREQGAGTQTHGGSRLPTFVRKGLHDARSAMASPNRNARSAVVIGRLLGIAFLICFGTGVYSHLLQDPLPGMRFPTRPVQLYQFTQGLHITAGIAIIPLLLAKLNTVMPALAQDPPVRNVLHFLERASIAVFVSASIVQVATGLVNTFQWYPWPFPFRQVHYALAYVIIGSLAIHIGAKLRVISRYWRKRDSYDADGRFVHDDTVGSELPAYDATAAYPRGITGRVMRWADGAGSSRASRPEQPEPSERTEQPERTAGRRERIARRGFFTGIAAATAGVVVLTAGQSSKLAEPFNVFAPRKRHIGPNGLPVNRTARAAGVLATATAADWTLTVAGRAVTRTFSRAELVALGTTEAALPISCVEGWSQMATWKGVRMRDLLRAVQADPSSHVRVTSLERHGGYRIMDMGPEYASDPTTLVALELNGATLDLDHGFPARIIAPGRPGVLQTKWIAKIEVLS